jgi:hypothetical protein
MAEEYASNAWPVSLGFLSVMGKFFIGISVVTLPVVVSITIIFGSDIGLGLNEIVIVLGGSIFVFFCGLYAGFLGVKYEQLQEQFETLLNPVRIGPRAANLIKAFCPVDHEQVVFVHVSPHRDDARPDGLDLSVGSCGHEVHRGEIEAEQEVDSIPS